jgi:hypothetical protein
MDERPTSTSRLAWLGLVLLAAALLYEFLWLARKPMGADLAFVVNRLGLKVVLRRGFYEVFAFGSVLLAACCVAAAWVAARHALGQAGAPARGGRLALAAAVVLVFASPLHYAVSWADGRLYELKVYDAAWSREQFLKELGLLASARLLWLAAVLAVGGYLLATPRRWPSAPLAAAVSLCGRVPRWLLVVAAAGVVTVLAAAFVGGVLGGVPLYPDAGPYYFQARTFAAGRLWSPLVGGREFFDPALCPYPGGTPFAFLTDRWFCVGLPFAPLCYAVGFVLGCPWLVGPVLGGVVVALTYALTREVFGRGAALVALPLAAVSPWLVFMSGEYLTHVPGAAAGLLFLIAAFRAMERGSWRWAAVAGLSIGLLANARPVTAAGYCAPTAVAWVIWLVRHRERAWRPTVAFAVALAVPMAGLLAYNAATTGSPTRFGYQIAMEGWQQVPDSLRTAPDWHWRAPLGVANVAQMLHGLDASTFRWPIPWLGVALATLLLLGGGGASRLRRAPLLLGLTVPALALAYARWPRVPYGVGGPRYVFEVVPVAIVLAAGALRVLYGRLVALGVAARRALAVLALVFVFCAAYGAGGAVRSDLRLYRAQARESLRMFRLIEAQAERPAIVFLPVPFGDRFTARLYLAVGQNAPALDGPIVYARDLGAENRRLAADLPGRHAYRWDDDAFGLVPIDAEEAR